MKPFVGLGRSVRPLMIPVWLAFGVAPAVAQGAVGSGPLTATLAEAEPETGVIRLGVLRIAPGLTISQIGYDSNVFDEAENPKDDFVVAGTPDVSVFSRMRWAQLSAYAGSDMQYYHEYESERAIGYSFKGRVDVLLSRLFPFVGAAETRNRTRPNGEIDVRADLKMTELSGGLGYELSTHANVFGSVIQTSTDYTDAFESGVSLDQSLSHSSTHYVGGFKTDLTPLLSLQVNGGLQQDDFEADPLRNGESGDINAVFTFSPVAVVTGTATIGYQRYEPVDPLVEPYSGMTASLFLTYPFLELGRFNVGYTREIEYSFDVNEAYYLQNTIDLVYTHRLFGSVDAQVRGSWSSFDYGNREGASDRRDTLDSYNGNLGYNLPNRTRMAFNYEIARRRSPEIASRNYDRRRVFFSWTVAF